MRLPNFGIFKKYTPFLFFSLGFCLQLSWAQTPDDTVVFEISDDRGTRLEIAITADDQAADFLWLRLFENQNDLVWEHPLHHRLTLNGQGNSAFPNTVIQIHPQENSDQNRGLRSIDTFGPF